jgi:peptidyl-tRNA hydrolase
MAIYKMYCVMSRDALKKMGGNRGKMIAMGGHAFVHSWWASFFSLRHLWAALRYKFSRHAYKITLAVDTEEDLVALQDKYRKVCGVSLVEDAAFTVFKEPTTACLGIGPIAEKNLGDDLKPGPNGLKALQ